MPILTRRASADVAYRFDGAGATDLAADGERPITGQAVEETTGAKVTVGIIGHASNWVPQR